MSDERRALVPARARNQILEAVRDSGGNFDIDFLHVIETRDDELIKNEILFGAGSPKFVYDFQIAGTQVSGISVIGARHLAAHYGALKHRLVAAVQKTGSLFTFTSYPHDGQPMQVDARRIPELEDEPDFYEAVVEIEDIKVGNTIQVQRREMKFEKRRDGSLFERPHYATIAQSKAYRNAILNLLPQDITLKWKQQMLALDKKETVTESVLDQKRHGVIQFAAARALTFSREAVHALTMEQIAGLADAAREGRLPAFTQAAAALGLLSQQQAIGVDAGAPPQQGSGSSAPASPPPHQAEAGKGDQRKKKPSGQAAPPADPPAQADAKAAAPPPDAPAPAAQQPDPPPAAAPAAPAAAPKTTPKLF